MPGWLGYPMDHCSGAFRAVPTVRLLTQSPLNATVPQVLHMTLGLDTVVARGRNVSVNGMAVPEGRPQLLSGEG